MKAFNHVAGGIVFTGLFSSIADRNIFETFGAIATTVIFSQLPDIDHAKALIGKIIPPLSKYIQKTFGHRTITHSFLAIIAISVLMKLFDSVFQTSFSIFAVLAYSSHIIFDMCTRAGVQFFYPFSIKPAVLPANPNLRIQTNDLKAEVIIFTVFCVLGLTMIPLFTAGFWTKYNRFFMTFDHLQREMKTKSGTYKIDFVSEGEELKGEIVELNNSKALILVGGEIKEFEISKLSLEDFKKVGYHLEIVEINEESKSLEDFKNLQNNILLEGAIQSNMNFIHKVKAIEKETKYLEFKNEWPDIRPIIFKDSTSVQIERLKQRKEVQNLEYNQKKEIWEREKQLIENSKKQGVSNLGILKNQEVAKALEIHELKKPFRPNLTLIDFEIKNLQVSQELQAFNYTIKVLHKTEHVKLLK